MSKFVLTEKNSKGKKNNFRPNKKNITKKKKNNSFFQSRLEKNFALKIFQDFYFLLCK